MMYTGPNDNSNAIPADMSVEDAIRAGNSDVLESFLREGTNPNQTDSTGLTLLHYAVLTNQAEALALLIKHGADVTPKDNAGNSPLHVAAQTADAAIIHLLIENGARETRANGSGEIAIEIAKRAENHSAIQALETASKIRQLASDVYCQFINPQKYKNYSLAKKIFSPKYWGYAIDKNFAELEKEILFYAFYKRREALLSCYSSEETYKQLVKNLSQGIYGKVNNDVFIDNYIIYNSLILQSGRAMAAINHEASSMTMPFGVAEIVANHLPIYNAQLPEHQRLFRAGYYAQRHSFAPQNKAPKPIDSHIKDLLEPEKTKKANIRFSLFRKK